MNFPSQPGRNPFPAVRAGVKLYYLGAYLGEVLRRRAGGEWAFDEKDPLGQIRAELRLTNGKFLRPIEEVMKRLEHGGKADLSGFAASAL